MTRPRSSSAILRAPDARRHFLVRPRPREPIGAIDEQAGRDLQTPRQRAAWRADVDERDDRTLCPAVTRALSAPSPRRGTLCRRTWRGRRDSRRARVPPPHPASRAAAASSQRPSRSPELDRRRQSALRSDVDSPGDHTGSVPSANAPTTSTAVRTVSIGAVSSVTRIGSFAARFPGSVCACTSRWVLKMLNMVHP